jgi:hypothetical protein
MLANDGDSRWSVGRGALREVFLRPGRVDFYEADAKIGLRMRAPATYSMGKRLTPGAGRVGMIRAWVFCRAETRDAEVS